MCTTDCKAKSGDIPTCIRVRSEPQEVSAVSRCLCQKGRETELTQKCCLKGKETVSLIECQTCAEEMQKQDSCSKPTCPQAPVKNFKAWKLEMELRHLHENTE